MLVLGCCVYVSSMARQRGGALWVSMGWSVDVGCGGSNISTKRGYPRCVIKKGGKRKFKGKLVQTYKKCVRTSSPYGAESRVSPGVPPPSFHYST